MNISTKKLLTACLSCVFSLTIYGISLAAISHSGVASSPAQQKTDPPTVIEGVTKVFTSSQVSAAQTMPVDALMREDFEGEWPGVGWELVNPESDSGRDFLWGKRDCHPHLGGAAGWSVGGGEQGSQLLCTDNYPDNIQSTAFYGPFDLTNAISATLTYYIWGQSELGTQGCYDALFVGSSADKERFRGSFLCGNFTNGDAGNGYYERTLDLSERLGESQVWIAFTFVSDVSINYMGFMLDDISIDVITDSEPTETVTPVVTPSPTVTTTPEPTSTWQSEIVDSNGNLGQHSSLAIDSSGIVHISYYDETNGDLKYAFRSNDEWHIEVVDSVGNVGQFTSLALDASNKVHISYYDLTNGDLKHAHQSDSGWNIETVENRGNVGKYTSLAVDDDGVVHISYYDETNGDLKHAFQSNDGWHIEALDAANDVGAFTSLGIDDSDQIHVGYYAVSNGVLRYGKFGALTTPTPPTPTPPTPTPPTPTPPTPTVTPENVYLPLIQR